MAISAYTGLPGSGKSYSIFEHVILPALKAGREVWTNIPFDTEALSAEYDYCPVLFDIDDINNNDRWFSDVLPKGVICVIDEVWRLWPSGLKANNAKADHLEFIAEHRHLVGEAGNSTEIILATQDLSQIAAFARNLVDKTYRMTKLDAVGQNNRFRIDIYQGPATGPNPPKSSLLDQRYGSYKPDVYRYYKSQTKSDIETIGDESRTDNRHNLLTGNWLKYSIAAIVLGVIFVLWAASSVIDYYSDPDPEPSQTANPLPGANSVYPGQTLPLPEPEVENTVVDVIAGRTAYIAFNNGHDPYEYVIAVTDSGQRFRLTFADLDYLGYQLTPINECLVVLEVGKKKYQITCQHQEKRDLINFNMGGNSEST